MHIHFIFFFHSSRFFSTTPYDMFIFVCCLPLKTHQQTYICIYYALFFVLFMDTFISHFLFIRSSSEYEKTWTEYSAETKKKKSNWMLLWNASKIQLKWKLRKMEMKFKLILNMSKPEWNLKVDNFKLIKCRTIVF